MGAGSRATAQPATRVSWTLAMTWMGVFWGGASSGPHRQDGGDEKSWAKRIFLTYVSRVGHVEIRNLFGGMPRGVPATVLLLARVRDKRALRARTTPHDAIACAAQLPAALGGRALPDRRCALTGCAVYARALAVAGQPRPVAVFSLRYHTNAARISSSSLESRPARPEGIDAQTADMPTLAAILGCFLASSPGNQKSDAPRPPIVFLKIRRARALPLVATLSARELSTVSDQPRIKTQNAGPGFNTNLERYLEPRRRVFNLRRIRPRLPPLTSSPAPRALSAALECRRRQPTSCPPSGGRTRACCARPTFTARASPPRRSMVVRSCSLAGAPTANATTTSWFSGRLRSRRTVQMCTAHERGLMRARSTSRARQAGRRRAKER